MLLGVLFAATGCATGDEPLGKQDTAREEPDISFPKDTDRPDVSEGLDIGDGELDVANVTDAGSDGGSGQEDADPGIDIDPGVDASPGIDVDPGLDADPGVDADPMACGGRCTSTQVCESDVCVDVCQKTGSQCGAVMWSGTEVQCGSCAAPSACFENRCADNSGYRAIVAGLNHTCATLAQSGGARCWGKNDFGQLGNNQLGTDSASPVGVHVLSAGISQIHTRMDHNCAVHINGDIYCWGKNTLRQLGNSGTASAAVPEKATGISGVEMTAVGGGHSCALMKGSGEIQCWGEGRQGQLGQGKISDPSSAKSYVMFSLQTRLANNVSIGLGTSHSCSLVADGSVYCWGYNNRGQVGSPNTSYLWPTRVSGLEPVISLGVGTYHSCAVTQAGAVKCWGEGAQGQLGNGGLTNSRTPVSVQFQGAVRVERVVAGGHHSCAIDSTRKVWCWGANAKGQLGGDIYDERRATPYPVSDVVDVLTISAGFEHTCAVRTNGVAFCWGNNDVGQLGDGTTINRNKPVRVLN